MVDAWSPQRTIRPLVLLINSTVEPEVSVGFDTTDLSMRLAFEQPTKTNAAESAQIQPRTGFILGCSQSELQARWIGFGNRKYRTNSTSAS